MLSECDACWGSGSSLFKNQSLLIKWLIFSISYTWIFYTDTRITDGAFAVFRTFTVVITCACARLPRERGLKNAGRVGALALFAPPPSLSDVVKASSERQGAPAAATSEALSLLRRGPWGGGAWKSVLKFKQEFLKINIFTHNSRKSPFHVYTLPSSMFCLAHRCPTFWLFCATLSEEELS